MGHDDDEAAGSGPVDDTDVDEHALPGPARLFEMLLSDGKVVSVAFNSSTGSRRLSALAPGEDTPRLRLELDTLQATTLAALLSRRNPTTMNAITDRPRHG